jgi:hypothetical protein
VSGSQAGAGQRVVTPAVVIAALFTVAAALASAAFVTARGGLQLPVAPTSGPGVAAASPTGAPIASPPPSNATAASPAASPSLGPSPSPSPVAATPSAGPTIAPPATPTPGPTGPPDPLAALPACPGLPGCFEYTVRRFDSYTAVNDRFGLLLWITDALNPEIIDKRVIVVGQVMYLGRDPEARLQPCPDGAACRLYVVRAGDSLSTIAGRFGISAAGIRALNPELAAGLSTGQTIRLPLYQG